MSGKPTKVEVAGIVLAVEWERPADYDPVTWDGTGAVWEHFHAQGFDVQAVSQHVDGAYRVEVLSAAHG